MGAGLAGIWELVRAERDGAGSTELVELGIELELTAQRYCVRHAGEIADHGGYSVAQHTLTLIGAGGPNHGRTIPGIFQQVGDRLRICYGLDGRLPPGFTTSAGSPHYLAFYRRKSLPEKHDEKRI
jgi:uncharacterized protein (TIGR03067 family)